MCPLGRKAWRRVSKAATFVETARCRALDLNALLGMEMEDEEEEEKSNLATAEEVSELLRTL